MSKYCFDASSLITLVKAYPKKLFPSVWKKFESMVGQELIFSPMEVFLELTEGNDDLAVWAVEHKKKIFVEVDEEQIESVKSILSKHPRLHDLQKKKYDADPFVVGLAMQQKLIVVTDEKKTHMNGRVNISNVCTAYGIPSLKLLDFFEKIGINDQSS